MAGHILFDNNVLPNVLRSDSSDFYDNLIKCLWDNFPHMRIDNTTLALNAIVTPSSVIEILDIPKVLTTEPNYDIPPKLMLGDFRQRCIEEHTVLISDALMDRYIQGWVDSLPRTKMSELLDDHYLAFLSTGKHSQTIRQYLAIHRLMSFPYPVDKHQIHAHLLAQSISAMNANGFVPLLRISRAIATAFGQTKQGKKNGWYNNKNLSLKPQADHLDTELIQVALFGMGKSQSERAVCLTRDPAEKIRERIKLCMQVLVEYQSWAQEDPDLQPAPLPFPGYVAVMDDDSTRFVQIVDVLKEISPYMTNDRDAA